MLYQVFEERGFQLDEGHWEDPGRAAVQHGESTCGPAPAGGYGGCTR